MTNRGITMITDIKLLVSSDVSETNEVLHIPSLDRREWKNISAASFFVSERSFESIVKVFKFLGCRLMDGRPGYEFILLVGNETWQPNSKVVKYRKLWGAIKFNGIDIPEEVRFPEVCLEDAKGLKFYGGARLTCDLYDIAVKVLFAERASYIVAVPKGLDLDDLLINGWSGKLQSDIELVKFVSSRKGLVLKRFGDFDDPEGGFIAIGNPEIIAELKGVT
ncbi:hypothetical protein ACVW0Y_004708 [Pseudomonas sp. TE3786]